MEMELAVSDNQMWRLITAVIHTLDTKQLTPRERTELKEVYELVRRCWLTPTKEEYESNTL